jgi:ketosteroid isomerase-like protein
MPRGVLIAAEVALVAAFVAWAATAGSDGPQIALIPTLIVVTTKRFFGKKDPDADAAFGEHPAVAFIFKAMATGQMDGVEDIVDPAFHAYANGYSVVDPDDGDAADLFRENIEYWRSAVPDLGIDIYDEVSQKEPDRTDRIAVRFVISGTMVSDEESTRFETEAAVFLEVVDRKITEWRVVVDPSFFEELRHAMGL